MIAGLGGLLLPAMALGKKKAQRAQCVSNLKQIGLAIQMYADDHGGCLPGPTWPGLKADYLSHSDDQLVWHLTRYLAAPAPCEDHRVAPVFVCPGYLLITPSLDGIGKMQRRISYLANDNVNSDINAPQAAPFGYPRPRLNPLKYSALGTYGPICNLFAIADVDTGNIPDPTVTWWNQLPSSPVHGEARNVLYFDGHVSSRRDWPPAP